MRAMRGVFYSPEMNTYVMISRGHFLGTTNCISFSTRNQMLLKAEKRYGYWTPEATQDRMEALRQARKDGYAAFEEKWDLYRRRP